MDLQATHLKNAYFFFQSWFMLVFTIHICLNLLEYKLEIFVCIDNIYGKIQSNPQVSMQ